ncbi:hypothetical protein I3842_08G103700 [Carya illinoinensis]|uniref:Uncharacterized protein n=1 Tax=Carya illinoinensis TaxID=32201 RepID=A0A922JAB8_CARIL|nr:hypothetical protein I3842_08G103700 [Carya illinoinensis]
MYYFLYRFDDMFCDFCLQVKENITPIGSKITIISTSCLVFYDHIRQVGDVCFSQVFRENGSFNLLLNSNVTVRPILFSTFLID